MLREPRLVTAGLVLRPLAESDLGDIVAGLDDWEVARFLARVRFPYSRDDAETFLAMVRRGEAESTDLTLIVDQGGRPVGCMGLAGIGTDDEFGYWIARPHWGLGIASEAARAFLRYCFEGLGLEAVRSGAFADDAASLRVQRKLGFETTGARMRQSLARGREVAHIDTVLTRHRFKEAQK